MNYVNPESDGLLAYWRMNAWEAKDGGGNIVKGPYGSRLRRRGRKLQPDDDGHQVDVIRLSDIVPIR